MASRGWNETAGQGNPQGPPPYTHPNLGQNGQVDEEEHEIHVSPNASNFTVINLNIRDIAGNHYVGPGPYPQPPSVPQRRRVRTVTYYENATNFNFVGGTITTIGGNFYETISSSNQTPQFQQTQMPTGQPPMPMFHTSAYPGVPPPPLGWSAVPPQANGRSNLTGHRNQVGEPQRRPGIDRTYQEDNTRQINHQNPAENDENVGWESEDEPPTANVDTDNDQAEIKATETVQLSMTMTLRNNYPTSSSSNHTPWQ